MCVGCGLSVLVIGCGRPALRYCWRQLSCNLLQPNPQKWRTGSGHSRWMLNCCTWGFLPFEGTVQHFPKDFCLCNHTTPPSPVHTYLSLVPRSHKPADRVSRLMSPQLLRRLGTLTVIQNSSSSRQQQPWIFLICSLSLLASTGNVLGVLEHCWYPQTILS